MTCMRQAREPVLVQALVAEPAIERFDVGVLRRLARLDQTQRDSARVRPLSIARPQNSNLWVSNSQLSRQIHGRATLHRADSLTYAVPRMQDLLLALFHLTVVEILTWATNHEFVVLTHDLDVAAILAATSDRAPSVV